VTSRQEVGSADPHGSKRKATSPLRIAVISLYYAPEQTGVSYYNPGMCGWLAARGWQVQMHTGTPHYPWWRVPEPYSQDAWWRGGGVEQMDGVVVNRVRHAVPAPPLSGLKRMKLDFAYLWGTMLALFAVRRRPHVVVAVAPPFLTGLVAGFHAWRWRVPVNYHIQDLQVDAARELKMLPNILCSVLEFLERIILRRMRLVSTISTGMRRRIQQKSVVRNDIAIFPNWAATGTMRPHTGVNAYRREWGLDERQVVIAYSGNLGKKQGLDLLLAAFARLDAESHLHFVIAGEGADRGELEAEVQRLGVQRLRLLPLAPAARLAEFLSAADLHCVPQRRDAADTVMPSKLLNLMATARPVITTADAGTSLHEAVTRSGCGLVVEPDNVAALAAGILRLASDPALRERCGTSGRAYVTHHLDIDRLMGRHAAHLRILARCHQRLLRRHGHDHP